MRAVNAIPFPVPAQEAPFVVYVFSAADDLPLYVGVTSALVRRIRYHLRREWADQIARVAVESFASRYTAYARERELIDALQPRENRRGGLSKIPPDSTLRRYTGAGPVIVVRPPGPMLAWLRERADRKGIAVTECVLRVIEDAMDLEETYVTRRRRVR